MCNQKEPYFDVKPPDIEVDRVEVPSRKFDWFELMMKWLLACGVGFNLLMVFIFLDWLLK